MQDLRAFLQTIFVHLLTLKHHFHFTKSAKTKQIITKKCPESIFTYLLVYKL